MNCIKIEEEYEYEVHQQPSRGENTGNNGTRGQDEYVVRNVVRKTSTTTMRKPKTQTKPKSAAAHYNMMDDDDDEVDDSMLPNDTLPAYMDVTDNDQSFHFSYGPQSSNTAGVKPTTTTTTTTTKGQANSSSGGSLSGGANVIGDVVMKGDRVMKIRSSGGGGGKNRPSLLDYYGESSSSSSTYSKNPKLHEHDIDETFDFLDEELKKY